MFLATLSIYPKIMKFHFFIFKNRNCSALVEKGANLKVMRVCNTLITFKLALLQDTAEK